jgi:large subunit ribosomal protein L24
MRIRKGDTVVVIRGRYRHKVGKVLKVYPDKDRVVIEGVNFIKVHERKTQKTPQGGILEKEGTIHVSNVMLYDPKLGVPSRIRMRTLDDGSRVREAVQSGEILPDRQKS